MRNAAQHRDDHRRRRDDPAIARRADSTRRAAAGVSARRRRPYRLDGVLGGAVAAFRGVRPGASRLRPIRRSALARSGRRSRLFLSRFLEDAGARSGAPGRHLARRLDRGRAGGAQHRAARQPDPGRRGRDYRRRPADPRHLPHAGRGEFAPVLRRSGTRGAAGRRYEQGRHEPGGEEPGDRDAART